VEILEKIDERSYMDSKKTFQTDRTANVPHSQICFIDEAIWWGLVYELRTFLEHQSLTEIFFYDFPFTNGHQQTLFYNWHVADDKVLPDLYL